MSLENKKILLIIGGGISAYKSLDLIRLLQKKGCSVKAVLTKSGKKFVTSLSLSSLSNNRVFEEVFDDKTKGNIDHISLSRWSDLIIVLPATANFMSRLSKGSADDLASTIILASNKEIFLIPAMNVRMWEHQSTKNNFKILKDYGYKFIGPEMGDMACGEYGEGKMSEPLNIFNEISNYLNSRIKNNKIKALVTAGPTNEYIDPVRFITNKSSGKQGYQLAKSLSKRGFETTLISGPTNLDIGDDIKLIKVQTAKEMFEATQKSLPTDIAVFTAAVADFKIINQKKNKIKKNEDLFLKFEKNVDILNYVSKHNSMRPKLVIGFAAETDELEKNANTKLSDKSCDWIIANDVSKKNAGFNSDYNEVTIYYKDKKIKKENLSLKKKSEIAEEIVDRIVARIN